MNTNVWIPVEKCLPEAGGHYLVTTTGQYVSNTLVKYSPFINGKFDVDNVITWMNLYLPYKFLIK